MDDLEKILSVQRRFRVTSILKEIEKLIGVVTDIKEIFTFESDKLKWIMNYQSKDMYELVKYYYQKRIEGYIQVLEGKL